MCDEGDSAAAGSWLSEGRGYGHCCPHVVDVEWFALLLGALGVGTVFLRNQITMNIAGRKRKRRRRRRSGGLGLPLQQGTQCSFWAAFSRIGFGLLGQIE